MCFSSKSAGPTEAESKVAAEQKVEAEAEVQEVVQERAQQKAEDIEQAISKTAVAKRRGTRGSGGSGRRSLFRSSAGGAGFLSRFDL